MSVKNDLQIIMDVFTGEDGGINFIKLRTYLEGLEEKNDQNAEAILDIVNKFTRLLIIVNKLNFSDRPKDD